MFSKRMVKRLEKHTAIKAIPILQDGRRFTKYLYTVKYARSSDIRNIAGLNGSVG